MMQHKHTHTYITHTYISFIYVCRYKKYINVQYRIYKISSSVFVLMHVIACMYTDIHSAQKTVP